MRNECDGMPGVPRRGRCLALQRLRLAGLVASMAAAQMLGAALGAPGHAAAATIEAEPVPGPPGVAEGRVYEQVSPVTKNGNQAGPGVKGGNTYGLASSDGSRVLYSDSGPIGEAHSGVDPFSVSERSASGWSTRAVMPAPPPAPRDPVSPFDPVWLLPSGDLSNAAFIAHNPFAPSGIDFSNPNFAFASTYLTYGGAPATWIGAPTVEDPLPALEEVTDSSNLALVGASSDLSVVYYEYYGTLVPEDAARREVVAGENTRAWGLYEWREGRLKAAGILPPGEESPYAGEEDPYGAVGAGIGENFFSITPPDFANEVSRSGNTLLFMSPAPESESGRPPQLYARLNGNRTELVSRSALTGHASLAGPVSVNDLSETHDFYYAYGSPDGSQVFFTSEEQLTSDAPVEPLLKTYQFDLATETLTYLPGVVGPIVASSDDGSTLVFDDSPTGEGHLDVSVNHHITEIAPLPPTGEGLYVAPARLTTNNTVLVFQTNAQIAGFNSGGFGQVYKYDLSSDGLSCVSCPSHGEATGTASLSNDSIDHTTHLLLDDRGVSEDGSQIFFDTPTSLVPEDQNEVRDVYEWHDGQVSLISSGKGTEESLFLDNSASGNDVFFATRDALTSSDTDQSYDVYDARVGGGFPVQQSPPSCSATCPSAAGTSLTSPLLASSSPYGAGEQASGVQPGSGNGKPAVTRAQRLAKSLKACRRKRGHRRKACEAQARRRYGPRAKRRHT